MPSEMVVSLKAQLDDLHDPQTLYSPIQFSINLNRVVLGILYIKERRIWSKGEASNHGTIHNVLHRFYSRCPRALHQLRLAENCQW
jgi:hypothetical protein